MLQVYTPPIFKAEKQYVLSVLLNELLGVKFKLNFNAESEHYKFVLPNGAQLTVEDHFFAKKLEDNYLDAGNIPNAQTLLPHPFAPGQQITGIHGRPHFEQSDRVIRCGIDLIASTFFMLSRWEEYAWPERDQFDRFPAEYALAFRAGFLDRPVVNEYADLFWGMLLRLGWNQPRRAMAYRLHLSHDVDHPLLWPSPLHRLRTLAGSVRRPGGFGEAKWWLQQHFFAKKDPYDVFDTLMDISEKNGLVSHFNFLGERPKTADCYYSLAHPFVRNLLQKITDREHVIGFHPSREAHADAAQFESELESLRQIAPQEVTTGRQHYLCFSAPETWRRWAKSGMHWDSTLGYPEAEGFRCGICCAFPVFDFLKREVLPLREKPLIAMDVTLAQYRNYNPEQAFEKLTHLNRQVKKHRGEFVLLWHNSSWNTYFWTPWQAVYRDFVAQSAST
ncbi:MAG: polysaccharide deacetylase family protein [Saprospiraceae bacterium]|nr:polysaccharide deacetylase family protein [Saprospiraceae bacterium]